MEKVVNKETIFRYIKNFSSISIKEICVELGLEKDYANIMKGIASTEKMEKVAKELQKRLVAHSL